MYDIYFQELRIWNKNIKKIDNENEKKQGYELLCETIEKMLELANVAREEGLLALTGPGVNLEELHNKEFLNSMITLITDGIDPDLFVEISTTKYFSTNLEDFDALQYIIMLTGCLAIQAGENPRLIEEKLLSLVPMEVEEEYRRKQEEKNGQNECESKSKWDRYYLDKYCQGDIAAKQGEAYYFQLKITDCAIRSLDDRCVQRLLRDIDNSDIALALIGLSGNARRKVFDNLSKRLAFMIADDMEYLGTVEMFDVANAALVIFNTLLRLILSAEIICPDMEAMIAIGNKFDMSMGEKSERQLKTIKISLDENQKQGGHNNEN